MFRTPAPGVASTRPLGVSCTRNACVSRLPARGRSTRPPEVLTLRLRPTGEYVFVSTQPGDAPPTALRIQVSKDGVRPPQ
jgi:hypothetical protein